MIMEAIEKNNYNLAVMIMEAIEENNYNLSRGQVVENGNLTSRPSSLHSSSYQVRSDCRIS